LRLGEIRKEIRKSEDDAAHELKKMEDELQRLRQKTEEKARELKRKEDEGVKQLKELLLKQESLKQESKECAPQQQASERSHSDHQAGGAVNSGTASNPDHYSERNHTMWEIQPPKGRSAGQDAFEQGNRKTSHTWVQPRSVGTTLKPAPHPMMEQTPEYFSPNFLNRTRDLSPSSSSNGKFFLPEDAADVHNRKCLSRPRPAVPSFVPLLPQSPSPPNTKAPPPGLGGGPRYASPPMPRCPHVSAPSKASPSSMSSSSQDCAFSSKQGNRPLQAPPLFPASPESLKRSGVGFDHHLHRPHSYSSSPHRPHSPCSYRPHTHHPSYMTYPDPTTPPSACNYKPTDPDDEKELEPIDLGKKPRDPFIWRFPNNQYPDEDGGRPTVPAPSLTTAPRQTPNGVPNSPRVPTMSNGGGGGGGGGFLAQNKKVSVIPPSREAPTRQGPAPEVMAPNNGPRTKMPSLGVGCPPKNFKAPPPHMSSSSGRHSPVKSHLKPPLNPGSAPAGASSLPSQSESRNSSSTSEASYSHSSHQPQQPPGCGMDCPPSSHASSSSYLDSLQASTWSPDPLYASTREQEKRDDNINRIISSCDKVLEAPADFALNKDVTIMTAAPPKDSKQNGEDARESTASHHHVDKADSEVKNQIFNNGCITGPTAPTRSVDPPADRASRPLSRANPSSYPPPGLENRGSMQRSEKEVSAKEVPAGYHVGQSSSSRLHPPTTRPPHYVPKSPTTSSSSPPTSMEAQGTGSNDNDTILRTTLSPPPPPEPRTSTPPRETPNLPAPPPPKTKRAQPPPATTRPERLPSTRPVAPVMRPPATLRSDESTDHRCSTSIQPSKPRPTGSNPPAPPPGLDVPRPCPPPGLNTSSSSNPSTNNSSLGGDEIVDHLHVMYPVEYKTPNGLDGGTQQHKVNASSSSLSSSAPYKGFVSYNDTNTNSTAPGFISAAPGAVPQPVPSRTVSNNGSYVNTGATAAAPSVLNPGLDIREGGGGGGGDSVTGHETMPPAQGRRCGNEHPNTNAFSSDEGRGGWEAYPSSQAHQSANWGHQSNGDLSKENRGEEAKHTRGPNIRRNHDQENDKYAAAAAAAAAAADRYSQPMPPGRRKEVENNNGAHNHDHNSNYRQNGDWNNHHDDREAYASEYNYNAYQRKGQAQEQSEDWGGERPYPSEGYSNYGDADDYGQMQGGSHHGHEGYYNYNHDHSGTYYGQDRDSQREAYNVSGNNCNTYQANGHEGHSYNNENRNHQEGDWR